MARRGCSSRVVLLVVVALTTLVLQVTKAEWKDRNDIGDGSRIVGGQAASSAQFPWQVYVVTKEAGENKFYRCGGSIISTTWVMSAAHCFTKDINNHEFEVDVSRIYIYAGLTDKSERSSDPDVQKNIIEEDDFDDHLFNHKDYKKGAKYNNDITLIKLKEQLTLTDRVQPIALATSDDFIPGKKLTVSGWGDTSANGETSDILQYVDGLNLISREECQNFWSSDKITDNMICHRTDDRNTCGGDSGGPVITGTGNSNGPPYVQIGIVSWGSKICDSNTHPKVFVDVAKFKDWMSQTMSGDDCTNTYDETNCESWANAGFCEEEFVEWLTENCKKSCNKCGNAAVCESQCVNGACTAPNTCTCDQGWNGPQCQIAVCESQCVNGVCTAPNTCSCGQGWDGAQCQNAVCESQCVNGACTAPNTCTCDQGWDGAQCQNGGDCTDKYTDCEGWADSDYCVEGQWISWMAENCKESCDKCGGNSGDCTDKYTELGACEEWADRDYCVEGLYISWMLENCKKSCDKCGGNN